MTLSVPVWNH